MPSIAFLVVMYMHSLQHMLRNHISFLQSDESEFGIRCKLHERLSKSQIWVSVKVMQLTTSLKVCGFMEVSTIIPQEYLRSLEQLPRGGSTTCVVQVWILQTHHSSRRLTPLFAKHVVLQRSSQWLTSSYLEHVEFHWCVQKMRPSTANGLKWLRTSTLG